MAPHPSLLATALDDVLCGTHAAGLGCASGRGTRRPASHPPSCSTVPQTLPPLPPGFIRAAAARRPPPPQWHATPHHYCFFFCCVCLQGSPGGHLLGDLPATQLFLPVPALPCQSLPPPAIATTLVPFLHLSRPRPFPPPPPPPLSRRPFVGSPSSPPSASPPPSGPTAGAAGERLLDGATDSRYAVCPPSADAMPTSADGGQTGGGACVAKPPTATASSLSRNGCRCGRGAGVVAAMGCGGTAVAAKASLGMGNR